MNLFTMILFLVLSHEYALGIYLTNLTKLLEQRLLGATNHQDHLPAIVFRDLSYLPEIYNDEDYNNDNNNNYLSINNQLFRNDRNLLPEYRNLCEVKTKKVQLNDEEFEYQPPHYHEVYCKSYSLLEETELGVAKKSKQMCAHPGFQCIQRSRVLSMVRRRWVSGCWEPFTKEIASGCECMWPVSTLGDISAHY
ncbi:uncharacterized protein LOC141534798 isoform X2 [Cotesia typhae]|uniref:uncharacterized protein LOC141534798 isoform X2 n=1 Tax=Cotesia typhae TaxID=2053667 RepID=UPI003D69287B